MKTRIAYINTHAGQALREGGVAWMLKEFDPDLFFLAEVVRRPAKNRVRKIFDPKKYSVTGVLPHEKHLDVESGTIVCAKRSVWKRKWWSNQLLTRQRWVNGRRDKWHPMRRLTRAFYVSAGDPKVRLHVSPIHLWTHQGYPVHGEADVPTEYRKQADAYAAMAGESVRQGAATAHVGDGNALGSDGSFLADKYVRQGMKVLHRHGPDFLFGSKKVKVLHVTPLPQGKVHTDHDAFIIDLEISA